MKPSGFYDLTIAANASAMLLVAGDYFKIMSATGAVNVKSTFGELRGLIAGQGLESTPFDGLTIQNATGASNTVRVFVGDENFIDGFTGNVGVTSNAAARDSYTQATATVTTTAANAVAAGTRDYVMIQNKSLTGTVYLNFQTTATVANGVRLRPGEAWESGLSVPQGAISAIGDIASNPDVIVVTGV